MNPRTLIVFFISFLVVMIGIAIMITSATNDIGETISPMRDTLELIDEE